MFKDKTIRDRVMKIVNDRIESAQKEFDAFRKTSAEEVLAKIEEIHRDHENRKAEKAEELVRDILGKVI